MKIIKSNLLVYVSIFALLGLSNVDALPVGGIAKLLLKNSDEIVKKVDDVPLDDGGFFPARLPVEVIKSAVGETTPGQDSDCENIRRLKEAESVEIFEVVEHNGVLFFEYQEDVGLTGTVCSLETDDAFVRTEYGWMKSEALH